MLFYRVYCEYNYGNEHNFKTPEDRVLHFLSRTKRPGWKWMSLRSRMPQKEPGNYYLNGCLEEGRKLLIIQNQCFNGKSFYIYY